MEIEKINFEECTSLKDLVSFETTDVMPEEITFSNRNWVHSKCYIHIDPKCHTLHGLIVLKDRHGEWANTFFRHFLCWIHTFFQISILGRRRAK